MSAVRSCYRPPSKKTLCASRRSVFLFSLFFHRSFNLLHPRFTMSCASLSLLQDMFSAEPVRSCYRPPSKKTLCASRRSVFLFSLFFHRSFNLLHPRFTMSCASLSLLQDMFSAEPVRSCYRPPLKRHYVLCAVVSFLFFLFSHPSFNLLHPRFTRRLFFIKKGRPLTGILFCFSMQSYSSMGRVDPPTGIT